MKIVEVTQQYEDALKLKNEAFSMPGRLIPHLESGAWTYRVEMFSAPQTMTFPEEAYTLNGEYDYLAAYEGQRCVGLAVFQNGFFRYRYLADLKVCADARGKGVGKKLIQAGLAKAKEQGCIGLYTIAQDNNLNACMFYLRTGFEIGGFDNRGYDGTSQQGKADIYFYLK